VEGNGPPMPPHGPKSGGGSARGPNGGKGAGKKNGGSIWTACLRFRRRGRDINTNDNEVTANWERMRARNERQDRGGHVGAVSISYIGKQRGPRTTSTGRGHRTSASPLKGKKNHPKNVKSRTRPHRGLPCPHGSRSCQVGVEVNGGKKQTKNKFPGKPACNGTNKIPLRKGVRLPRQVVTRA